MYVCVCVFVCVFFLLQIHRTATWNTTWLSDVARTLARYFYILYLFIMYVLYRVISFFFSVRYFLWHFHSFPPPHFLFRLVSNTFFFWELDISVIFHFLFLSPFRITLQILPDTNKHRRVQFIFLLIERRFFVFFFLSCIIKEVFVSQLRGRKGLIFHGTIPQTHGYIGHLWRHNSKNTFSFLVER